MASKLFVEFEPGEDGRARVCTSTAHALWPRHAAEKLNEELARGATLAALVELVPGGEYFDRPWSPEIRRK